MPQAAGSERGKEPPPLVCVHGLSGSSRWWTRVAALLDRNGPVVLCDVPRSLKPSEVATWLAERIEELGPPADLAGHSLGALVSVRVAALRPELVRRLVLISPPGVGPPRSPLAYAWPLARSMLGARPSFLVRLTYDGLRAGPRNLARGGLHVARADLTAEPPLPARTSHAAHATRTRQPIRACRSRRAHPALRGSAAERLRRGLQDDLRVPPAPSRRPVESPCARSRRTGCATTQAVRAASQEPSGQHEPTMTGSADRPSDQQGSAARPARGSAAQA
jgi:pimeloyl-ACP methyl ester carboxylesterase